MKRWMVAIFLLVGAVAPLSAMQKPQEWISKRVGSLIKGRPKNAPEVLSVNQQWEKLFETSNRDITTIKKLIEQGADVNTVWKTGAENTLLMIAIPDNEELVRLLLDAKADVNRSNTGGNTALMLAAFNGKEEILRMLLAAAANIDAQNEHGDTALINAARLGNPRITQILINAHADLNRKNILGNNALMEAALNNRLENVKLLLYAGTKKEEKNNTGKTALQLARERLGNPEIIELLSSKTKKLR